LPTTRPFFIAAAACALTGVLVASTPQAPAFFPLADVRPGMVGVGRTVFAGSTIEEFRAHVIGVLRNVVGPRRDLILAKLEGGPLAMTGVIAGMSGSPVYIDGKLVGAVSYSLGSFPKEPIAGITPIAEMTGAVDRSGPRQGAGLALQWPATLDAVFSSLARVTRLASGAAGRVPGDLRIDGPASLADLAPALRPIGAAMVLSGLDPDVDRELRRALDVSPSDRQASARPGSQPQNGASGLRPGDPVGMSLVRGDLELGATGTVTHVDGDRVYAFGHPFLGLGPTNFAMTKAFVYTVLPSLDSSMKIAGMGPVIGTMTQDRATAVGGRLGAGPRELQMNVSLTSGSEPERRFTFHVLHDESLTPLFAYVALFNSLTGYERQMGALTIEATGTVSFGAEGQIEIDDVFSGDGAIPGVAGTVLTPVGLAATNEFKSVLPERVDIRLRVSERQEFSTIERVWLDTTKPKFGATHNVNVLLRDYRGARETISLPVVMPSQASGPLTLVVGDAATINTLEQRELRPGRPTSWPALLAQLRSARRGNRLYVRLITSSPGTVVGGDTLPALPASVRSILDDDKTVTTAPVLRTAVGEWERRMSRPVRGSRELVLTLSSR
jgi:hypothetical protein